MYELVPSSTPLFQGDVVEDCPLFSLEGESHELDLSGEPTRWRACVVVLTQKCDLAQNKVQRVLAAVVHPAADVVDSGGLKASVLRDQVRRGLVYGWYFLPAAAPPVRLPESVIDLRDLHTLSRTVLERLVQDGKRLCRIVTPYREHLAQHFAVTYSRIGLPAPYETQP